MNHSSLLSPNLTAMVNPTDLAITLAFLAVVLWIFARDWQGPEGRP